MNNVIRTRICQSCGKEFKGGPRAWYCPECRAERYKKSKKEYQERLKQGKSVKIGIDKRKCEICGKEYIVMSAMQRYCSECAPEQYKAVDRKQGMEWFREAYANEEYRKARNEKKRRNPRELKCIVCGKVFQSKTAKFPVCPECYPIYKSWKLQVYDYKRGRRKTLPTLKEWIEKRDYHDG